LRTAAPPSDWRSAARSTQPAGENLCRPPGGRNPLPSHFGTGRIRGETATER